VRLTVRDTGMGMPAEVVEHAFDPFFTTKGSGGTGLGLATVYGIVTQAGGHVRIESTLGAGTTFEVHLPALTAGAELPESSGKRRFARGAGERILIVEDEQQIAESTRRTLDQGGYRAVVAASAAEALEIVQSGEAVDLVLSDVVMPGIAGPALAARMAELQPGIGVIFMSGHVDGVVDVEGSSPLLAKPFTSEALLARVGTALASGADGTRNAA
jgi:CheY-like chemotaxis protein